MVDNGDGTFTYTPEANYSGADSFSYTVSDGAGGTDTATVSLTVNPANDEPVALDDSDSTAEDVALVIDGADLLSNDTDIDLDTLTIASFSQPSHGSVVDNGDGTFTYTPEANYNGADSFSYTVSDGAGGTDTATVSLTVNPANDEPVALDDSDSTAEDVALVIDGADLLSNDSDIDLDTLTIASFSQPSHGSVVDNGDGTFTYTPESNYSGADSFSYTVSDGAGGTDTATVSLTVNPANDEPVALDDSDSTAEDVALVIDGADLLSNDSDIDLDTLTIASFSQPSHGSVVDNGDGTFTYTPESNYSGADSFSYTVSDGAGGTDTATVSLTVNPANDEPVALDDSDSTAEDVALVIDGADLLSNDSDIDLDTLTIASFSQPSHGSVVDNGDGTFTYTPESNYSGADSFSYTVSDGAGGTDTATVSLTVNPANDEPVALDDSDSTAEDVALVIDGADLLSNDSDIDLDTLTIASFSQPSHGSVVDNGDGTFTYTPESNYSGADSFSYTVSDGAGGTDTATVSLTVNPANDEPVALDDSDSTAEDVALVIDGADLLSNDSDIDLDTLTIASFSQPSHGSVVDNGDGTFTYTPESNYSGADSFSYTVSDGAGGTDTATVSLTVNPANDEPVALDDSDSTAEDVALVIDGADLLSNDSDIDLDTLTIASFSQPSHGSVVDNGDGTFTYTPESNYSGADSFSYTVSDGAGGTDTATVSLTVNPANDEPVALDDSDSTAEDVALVIDGADLLSNDSDIDLDTLTIASFSQPSHGSVVDNGDGTFTYTPESNYSGADSFSYTVSDGAGGTDTATVSLTVNPANDEPVALDDSDSTAEDVALVIDGADLLSNDSDIDLDTLTIASFSQPSHGSVVDNGDGTFTYTPESNYSGADSFSYTVSDGAGGTDTATVSLTVNPANDEPVALDDSDSTAEDVALVIDGADLLSNDSDIDLDTLTIASFSQPSHGSVVDNGDGTFTYTPESNYSGADSFSYTVSDGAGGTDTATVSLTVNPANDEPVALDDSDSTAEDVALVIDGADLLSNDSDIDLDTLTIASFSQPSHGSVVDNGDGTFTYTPESNYSGADSFSYTVSDGAGGTDTATVSLTVNPANDEPVALDDSDSTAEDVALVIDGADLLSNDSDIDLDTLTIASFSQPSHGSVVDNGDGTFTYTPESNYSGADSFSYTVSDGAGGTDTATVSLTVNPANDEPVALDDSDSTAEDVALVIDGADLLSNDSDIDLDTLTIASFSQPSHGSVVDNGDGTFTYTPESNYSGADSFSYTVSDGAGGTDTATVSLTVNPANDEPVALDDSDSTAEDVALVIDGADLLSNDSDIDLDTLTIASFSQPSHGSVVDNGDGTFTYTPESNYSGADSFSYTVSDGAGGTDTATVSLTVNPANDEPVALDDSDSTAEDVALVIDGADLLSNDSDIDLDTLTIASFSQPSHGSVVDNGDGTFTYTPESNYSGADSFSYTVSDGAGGTDTATVSLTVNPANDEPVALDDSDSTAEDVALVIDGADLLSNDSDIDLDTLTIASFSQPSHGSVVDNGDGTFTYTPESNYSGADSFSYTVSDGAGGTDTATVSLTVNPANDEPVALDDSDSTAEDVALVIDGADLLSNDSDIDLDTLTIASFSQPSHGSVVDNGDGTFTYTPESNYSGADSFSYTVSDGAGGTDTATVSLTVNPANDEPVALDDSDSTAEDVALVIDGADLLSNDSDIDLDTLTIASFSQPSHGSVVDNGDGTFTYTPESNYSGADSFSYTVSDGAGGTDTATVSLTVNPANDEPVALDDSDSTAEDVALVIDGADLLSNDSDIDLDTLTIASFSQPSHGSVVDNGDGTFTYTPESNYSGADSFSYTVSDGAGGTDTATVSLTVNPANDEPVALDDSDSTAEDVALVIDGADLLSNDSDIDLDTLTIASFSQPSHGSVVDNGDGTFTYTPESNYSGADSFSYTVSDGAGGTDTATVSLTVNPANDEPVALDDSDSTAEDVALVIDGADLLSNDSDIDLDTLTIASFSQPSHGSVVDNGDGTFTYTPESNYSGADSFSYTVSDGAGGTDTATVSLTVNPANDEPVALDDSDSTAEDVALVIDGADLLSNDSDIDLDTLTIASFSQPSHGSVVDNGDGTFTYTPESNYSGADSFSYTVSDGAGGTDTATVSLTVNPANDEPVALDDSDSTAEDVALVIDGADLLSNDSDIDLDTLTIASFSQPSHGSVVDNGDGTFTYTPESNYSGADSFSYTVSDGAGGTDTATVSLTVNPANDEPVALDDSDSTAEDVALVIDGADLLSNDSDIDLDTLTIASFSQPSHGSVVDNGDGTFTYTPESNYSGADSFSYTVSDGAGGTDTATVSLTVNPANDEPVALDDSDSTAEDVALVIDGADLLSNDSDIDLDTLTIASFSQPSHGSVVDNGDGTFTYTPESNYSGADSFSYTVSDGAGGTDTATVSLTVNPANDEPVALDDSDSTAEDVALVIDGADLLSNDSDIDLDTLTIASFSQPSHGSVVDNGDGTFTYTPESNYSGADSFSYTVSDGAGGTDTATVSLTVNPANDEPVALDDSDSTAEDVALVIDGADLLSNDSDIDLDTLTIASFSQPSHGSVVDNGDGTFTYTPESNYSGADSFSYTVSDGAGGTDTATVSLTVNPANDEPVALDDSDSTAEDVALVIDGADLLSNDSDIDLDTLTIASFSQPSHGSVVDNGDGTFTYTPESNYSGADSFSYTVSDGAGGTDTATVSLTVNPANDEPVALDDSYSANEGSVLTTNATNDVLQNDTDVENELLTVLDFAQDSNGTGAIEANGTNSITTALGGIVVINVDGTFSYTAPVRDHSDGMADTDTFAYRATDGSDPSAWTTVTVDITDTGPGGIIQNYEAVEGDTASVSIIVPAATDTPATVVDGVYTGTLGTSVTVTNGVFDYTAPARDHNDTDGTSDGLDVETFTFDVQDSDGTPGTTTLNINITDTDPTANDDSDYVGFGEVAAGNVISGLGGDGMVADEVRADGVRVVSVDGDSSFQSDAGGNYLLVDGSYGQLKIYEDGSYEYISNQTQQSYVAGDGDDFSWGSVGLYGFGLGQSFDVTNLPADRTNINIFGGDDTRVGIEGGDKDDQIDFEDDDSGDTSETLVIDLKVNAARASLNLADFGSEDIAVWEAYDASGTLIGSEQVFSGDLADGWFTIDQSDISGLVKYIVLQAGDVGSNKDRRYSLDQIRYEKPDGQMDQFDYVLEDGDGSASAATLTITHSSEPFALDDSNVVYEAGLSSPPNISEGTDSGSDTEIATGNLLVNDEALGSGTYISSVTSTSDPGATVSGPDANGVITVSDAYGDLTVYTQDYNGNFAGDYEFVLSHRSDEGIGDTLTYEYDLYDPADGEASSSATLTINIVDDQPLATDISKLLTPSDGPYTVNLIVVLDRSGSMNELIDGESRLDIAKAALKNMFSAYDDLGNVNIQIVPFWSSTEESQWFADDINSANNYLDSIVASGGTEYDDALNRVIDDYSAPVADTSLVYFLSDGDPNDSHGVDNSIQYTDENGVIRYGEDAWVQFVVENGIDRSFGIGIGSGIDLTAGLNAVAYPGDGIDVVDESQLADTLYQTVNTGYVSDSVSTIDSNVDGVGGIQIGADGGYIHSITLDGETYTYDYDAQSITRLSDSAVMSTGSSTLTLTTNHGGLMTFNFLNGQYFYEIQMDMSLLGEIEQIVIVAQDFDGDQAASTLDISLDFQPVIDANRDIVLTNIAEGAPIDIPLDALLHNDIAGDYAVIEAAGNAVGGIVSGVDPVTFIDTTNGADSEFGTLYSIIDESILNPGDSDDAPLNNSIDTAIDLTDRTSFGPVTGAESSNVVNPSLPSVKFVGRLEADGSDKDEDYVKLRLRAGEVVILDVDNGFISGDPSSQSVDTYVYLYDSSGSLLQSNDDSNISNGGVGSTDTRDSFIQYQVASEGDYYVRVTSYGTGDSGNYDLWVSIDPGSAQQGSFEYTLTDGVASDDTTAAVVRSTESTISGTDEDEILIGSDGDDILQGGGGDDALVGNAGNDILEGGFGDDVFLFGNADDGHDTVTDFSVDTDADGLAELGLDGMGNDSINLDDLFDSLDIAPSDRAVDVEQSGENTILKVGTDDGDGFADATNGNFSITLEGISLDDTDVQDLIEQGNIVVSDQS